MFSNHATDNHNYSIKINVFLSMDHYPLCPEVTITFYSFLNLNSCFPTQSIMFNEYMQLYLHFKKYGITNRIIIKKNLRQTKNQSKAVTTLKYV